MCLYDCLVYVVKISVLNRYTVLKPGDLRPLRILTKETSYNGKEIVKTLFCQVNLLFIDPKRNPRKYFIVHIPVSY